MDFQIFQCYLKALWKYSKRTSNDLKLSTSRYFFLCWLAAFIFIFRFFHFFLFNFEVFLTDICHLNNRFIYSLVLSSERLHRFIEFYYRKSPKSPFPLSTHKHKDHVRHCANCLYAISPDKKNILPMSICYQRRIVSLVCTVIW